MSNVCAFQKTVEAFLINEDGATSIAYGLVTAGAATAVVSAFSSLGDALLLAFTEVGALVSPPSAPNGQF